MTVPILYEDRWLVVCEKPVGVLSAPEPGKRRNMPAILKRQTRAYRIDIIHRLDQPVGGVMVYSKDAKATPGLYKQMAGHHFVKEYWAVVTGVPTPAAGEMEDWLYKDTTRCKSRVVPEGTRGAKPARLTYETAATVTRTVGGREQTLSLVKVRLFTGRTHQIRVQFSHRGIPLLGDEKYGAAPCEGMTGLPLWSCHLAFRHPVTGKTVEGYSAPPLTAFPWSRFCREIGEQTAPATSTVQPAPAAPTAPTAPIAPRSGKIGKVGKGKAPTAPAKNNPRKK